MSIIDRMLPVNGRFMVKMDDAPVRSSSIIAPDSARPVSSEQVGTIVRRGEDCVHWAQEGARVISSLHAGTDYSMERDGTMVKMIVPRDILSVLRVGE